MLVHYSLLAILHQALSFMFAYKISHQLNVILMHIFCSLQSGRASLGEDLYQAITTVYIPIEEIFVSLSLKTEHSVLETINRLEGAVFAWNQRILEERSKRSPGRHSWSFMKDSSSELDKMSACIERVDALVQLLKSRYPNLPPTFIDVLKVQYNVVSSTLHCF